MNKNIKQIIINVLIVLLMLAGLIVIFYLAPNYQTNSTYVNNKINLIINNKNVTEKLKNDLFITEKNVIYMSKEDIKNYFDKYIFYDEDNKQMITTYQDNIGVLGLNSNKIRINDEEKSILSGVIVKNEKYYLPISEMSDIYNLDIKYVNDTQILLLDSLSKEQVKADTNKKINVKYKPTIFSKNMDKVKSGEKVILIEKLSNNWSKVRTENGYIGYIKTSNLKNENYIRRASTETDNSNEKINLVWDYFSEYATAPNRIGTTIEGINVVSPSFFSLISNGNGAIKTNIGDDGINYINWAKQNNYKVWAMFSNNSYKETTTDILKSYENRTNVINNITKLAQKYNLDGINIDFENMSKDSIDDFSRFIIELKPRLKAIGVILSVDVTAPDGGTDWSECYDRNIIGDVADYIVFMAYDQYGNKAKNAGTTAGYNWIENNLKKFIEREEIKSNKIILGIPFYTRLWIEDNGNITSKIVNMNYIENIIPDNVQKEWDDELKQYFIEYNQDGKKYKMWIEDEVSIKNKVSLVKKYNLAGVAAWEKDRETSDIWKIIKEELTTE